MSLLSDAMEPCRMLIRTVTKDGYGGYTETWTDGETISAATVLDSSIQAKQAEAAGVTGVYTVTTPRAEVLRFHDVFRRERDGKIFRVLSDGSDRSTPLSTALDMRQVSAEEWELPNG